MSATIPFNFRNYVKDEAARFEPLIEAYEKTLGDSDKVTDLDEYNYYEVRLETLCEALVMLLNVPSADFEAYVYPSSAA